MDASIITESWRFVQLQTDRVVDWGPSSTITLLQQVTFHDMRREFSVECCGFFFGC
jgi:hypothetical protein